MLQESVSFDQGKPRRNTAAKKADKINNHLSYKTPPKVTNDERNRTQIVITRPFKGLAPPDVPMKVASHNVDESAKSPLIYNMPKYVERRLNKSKAKAENEQKAINHQKQVVHNKANQNAYNKVS